MSQLFQRLLLPHAPCSLGTCSRARLSPSTSRWRRSALSSASSACCCRTWILRFTASMVVIPAMVPNQLLVPLSFLPPPLGAAAAPHPTSACSALKYRNSPTAGCDATAAAPSHRQAGGKVDHWREPCGEERGAVPPSRPRRRSRAFPWTSKGGRGWEEGKLPW